MMSTKRLLEIINGKNMDTPVAKECCCALKKQRPLFVCARALCRLVIAGVRTATAQGDGADDINGDFFTQAEIVDFHLTLSRTLLLLGASQEADGHARAAEQLSTTRNITTTAGYGRAGEGTAGSSDGGTFRGQRDGDNGDAAALRLEIELLSRTPVVLETVESASSLRRSLFAALKDSSKAETGFSGSIPNPLDVGLRTQFLATYQVKAILLAAVVVHLQDQYPTLTALYYTALRSRDKQKNISNQPILLFCDALLFGGRGSTTRPWQPR